MSPVKAVEVALRQIQAVASVAVFVGRDLSSGPEYGCDDGVDAPGLGYGVHDLFRLVEFFLLNGGL